LNTQTELLENHTARLTVEVEPERLEKAKQVAAKKLAGRLNIPGFRKGKAPYRVIVSYVGEGALIEDAVEVLGNEVYKEVITDADIEPYGPGQLEDVKVEGNPVFTFVVPLQPTVDLAAYRDVRVDYTPPSIEDADVDRSLRQMLEQEAVVEESHRPVEANNRLTVFIDGRLVDDEAEETSPAAEDAAETVEAVETDEAHDHDHGDDHDHDHEGEHEHHVDEKTIIHQHDAVISLTPDDEPLPGFTEAVAGMRVGESRQFELSYPDDEEYGELSGKKAKFDVTVKKIENVTLPALNDEFAARVTKEEEKPLSLLELRMRVRENLQKMTEERINSEYSRKALDAIVEQATVSYPEAMVGEQVQRFLHQFDQDLRQRGMTLDDYMKIYKKSSEDLYNDYRDAAVRMVRRSLVMREILEKEGIEATDDRVQEEIDKIAARFGEQADNYRVLFAEPAMRENVKNDLTNQLVLERIAAIAKNEAPEIGAASTEAQPETPDEVPEEKGESV
jgi:trigger factor